MSGKQNKAGANLGHTAKYTSKYKEFVHVYFFLCCATAKLNVSTFMFFFIDGGAECKSWYVCSLVTRGINRPL